MIKVNNTDCVNNKILNSTYKIYIYIIILLTFTRMNKTIKKIVFQHDTYYCVY